jgi:hypothetical protein
MAKENENPGEPRVRVSNIMYPSLSEILNEVDIKERAETLRHYAAIGLLFEQSTVNNNIILKLETSINLLINSLEKFNLNQDHHKFDRKALSTLDADRLEKSTKKSDFSEISPELSKTTINEKAVRKPLEDEQSFLPGTTKSETIVTYEDTSNSSSKTVSIDLDPGKNTKINENFKEIIDLVEKHHLSRNNQH